MRRGWLLHPGAGPEQAVRTPHAPLAPPPQPRWVGLIRDALGAQPDDALLLQHRHTDSQGVMHVAASLERASGDGGGAAQPQASWSPSAVANHSVGSRSDFGSQASEAAGAGSGEEVRQAKRSRRSRASSEDPLLPSNVGKPQLVCQYCGREYVYHGAHAK